MASLALALAACGGTAEATRAPAGGQGGAGGGLDAAGGAGGDGAGEGGGGSPDVPCAQGAATFVRCYPGVAGALRIGPDGALYLGGTTSGGAAFGGVTVHADVPEAAYVVKLDADANGLWATALFPTDTSTVRGLALAPDGGVVVTGLISRSWRAGEQTTYVAKLDATGALVWSLVFELPPGAGVTSSGFAVAVDDTGTIAVAGYAPEDADLDPYDFGPPDYPVTGGGGNAYLVGLDPSGKPLWEHRMGQGWGFARTVASDGQGGFLVGGEYDEYVGIHAIAADGSLAWERAFAAFGGVQSIEVLDGGSIRAVGIFSGGIDLGLGAGPVEAGSWSPFALSLDASGAVSWGVTFPTDEGVIVEQAVTDAAGRTLFAGDFNTPLAWPFGTFQSAGDADVLLGALGPEGEPLGGLQHSMASVEERPGGLALDPAGRPWLFVTRYDALQTTQLARFEPLF